MLILQHLKHERIIDLIEVYHQNNCKYLVFEHMDTDLGLILHSSQTLTDRHVRHFALQLLEGVAVIHNARVIHRDLKPSNILVNRDCRIKIADFGLAREVGNAVANASDDNGFSHYRQTRWYRSPEMILEMAYGMEIDMWSVGCIFAEMICRRALFKGKDDKDQLRKILSFTGMPLRSDVEAFLPTSAHTPQQVDARWRMIVKCKPDTEAYEAQLPVDDATALLRKLLQFNPHRRCSAEQAIAHAYFDEETMLNRVCTAFEPFPSSTSSLSATDTRAQLQRIFGTLPDGVDASLDSKRDTRKRRPCELWE